MNILIDIGHPAHVHLFKNFAWKMMEKGHHVLFTCREKEFEIELLQHYGFHFISFGKKYKSIPGKILGMIKFDLMEYLAALKFKPDMFLSHGSMYAAHASFMYRKPHIALEDTGNMEQIRLYEPFSDVLLTPKSLEMKLGKKQINYNGYHELAYLNSSYFKPNFSLLELLNISNNDKFVLIRFVSWEASHDLNNKGIDLELKYKIIDKLQEAGYKVFISSEGEIPPNLIKFKINIAPQDMHHVLYYAHFFIGEGATMANESAILGTPAIYVNSRKACIGDLERYGLLYHIKSSENLLPKLDELIRFNNLKKEWQKRRERMLRDKIDVTSFLVWFVENYPESVRIMREDPDYQYRFK